MDGNYISRRIVGGLPLSIGTSLAFESIFSPTQKPYDPDRPLPPKVNLEDYEGCWINLQTLFRNLTGSMEKTEILSTPVQDFATTLLAEIDALNTLFSQENKPCRVKFYLPQYDGIHHDIKRGKYQEARLRVDVTDNAKHYRDMETKTLKALNQMTDEIVSFKDGFDREKDKRVLLVSHQPYDLIHFDRFQTLDLLESHTGLLKTRKQWNSKYYRIGTKPMDHLPFFFPLLMIFGDKTMFHPLPMNLRQVVYDISIGRDWTPLTTKDRIKHCFEIDIRDPLLSAVLRSYFYL